MCLSIEEADVNKTLGCDTPRSKFLHTDTPAHAQLQSHTHTHAYLCTHTQSMQTHLPISDPNTDTHIQSPQAFSAVCLCRHYLSGAFILAILEMAQETGLVSGENKSFKDRCASFDL